MPPLKTTQVIEFIKNNYKLGQAATTLPSNLVIRDFRTNPGQNPSFAQSQLTSFASGSKDHEESSLARRAESYLNGFKKILLEHSGSETHSKIAFETKSDNHFKIMKSNLNSAENDGERLEVFNDYMKKMHYLVQDVIGANQCTLEQANKYMQEAEAMHVWEQGRDAVVTLNTTTNADGERFTIAQIDTPRFDLTDKQAFDFFRIVAKSSENRPEWFNNMESWQKNYLLEKVEPIAKKLDKDPSDANFDEAKGKLSEALKTTPSFFRKIPGLANYGDHSLVIMNNNGEVVSQSTEPRSSIVAPITYKGTEQQKKEIVHDNLDQLLQSHSQQAAQHYVNTWGVDPSKTQIPMIFLAQTLVSPMFSNKLNTPESEKILNQKIVALQQLSRSPHYVTVKVDGKEVEAKVNLKPVGTNHPVNNFRKGAMRLLLNGHAAHNKQEADKFEQSAQEMIDSIKTYAKENNSVLSSSQAFKLDRIEQALSDYRAIRNDKGKNLNQGKQLFLSSLEQIITSELGGISHSSCKSGKDREGMKLLHTDAMRTYRTMYGELPKVTDTGDKRQNFVNIMADFFLSNHQQYVADQNAPGCNGLKATTAVMPNDLLTEVKQRIASHNANIKKPEKKSEVILDPFKNNKQNADLNKPKAHIMSSKLRSNLNERHELEATRKKNSNTAATTYTFAKPPSNAKPTLFSRVTAFMKTNPISTGLAIVGTGMMIGSVVGLLVPPVGAAIMLASLAAGAAVSVGGMIYNRMHPQPAHQTLDSYTEGLKAVKAEELDNELRQEPNLQSANTSYISHDNSNALASTNSHSSRISTQSNSTVATGSSLLSSSSFAQSRQNNSNTVEDHHEESVGESPKTGMSNGNG